MKSIFERIKQWVIEHQADIILVIGAILISFLSFAVGYIVAKEQEKESLRLEYPYELRIKPNYELTKEFRITETKNLFVIRGNS